MMMSLNISRDCLLESDDSINNNGLSISTVTWGRDSHELFDYETSQTHSQQFRIAGTAVELHRKGNEVIIVPDGEINPPSCEYLMSARFYKSCGTFRIFQKAGIHTKKLWSVVRSNFPSGVRLHEGLTIKLGRFKLRVRQICTKKVDEGDDRTSCSSDEIPVITEACVLRERHYNSALDLGQGDRRPIPAFSVADGELDNSVKHFQCRICLSEGPTDDDPLICPCECTGSIRYVHAGCLGHWLRGRLGLETFNGSVYFFRPLACELCHCVYPSYFESGGNRFPLASLPETKIPFIVFENIGMYPHVAAWNTDHSNTFPTGLHIVRFSQNQSVLKIGRGHECQMRISDVSISRLHAFLRMDENGDVFLEDQHSKFGTLVDAETGLDVPNNGNISIQSGRTLITLSTASPTGSDQETVNDTDMFEDTLEDEGIDSDRPHTH